jgi:hypothetical protein
VCPILWKKYAIPFTGAYILTLIVYSYFYTTIIFTNHTFPSSWVQDYPSFKTLGEGRWFADILVQLTGGSGVQSFQMALASGIQVVNALLFAALLHVTNRFYIFLVAAFLSLHPAFLDYYSFTVDQVSFTIGDTLALLGVIALDRVPDRRMGVLLATLCFVLTLATYQPKIALVASLLLIWCVQGTSLVPKGRESGNGRQSMLHLAIRYLLPAAFTFATALGLYYLSVKLTVILSVEKSQTNDLEGVFSQLMLAYPETFRNFTVRVDYLPNILKYVPALGILLGTAAVACQAYHVQKGLALAALMLVALFPAALQLSYIINEYTWQDTGRVLAPHAYCLLFFLTSGWSLPWFRPLATFLVAVLVYYFCIVGTQETNAVALKTSFDLGKINRIVTRLESIVPDLCGRQLPVVVVGQLAFTGEETERLKRYPNNLYKAQVREETFKPYRQVELLNFFLGRDAVSLPTQAQLDAALVSQQGRRPWPAPDSVYEQDGVIMILLEPYGPDVPVTWPR